MTPGTPGALTIILPVRDDFVRWLPECVASVWAQRHASARAQPRPGAREHAVRRLRRRRRPVPRRLLRLHPRPLPGARPEVVAVGMRPIALDNQTGHERPFPWPTDGAIAASRRRRRLALRGLLEEPSIVMSGSTFRTSALRPAGG